MEQENLTPMQAYEIGEIVDFKVRKWHGRFTDLIDEKTGIISYLQGTSSLVLIKGQIVRCRVLAVDEKHPKIELVDISELEQGNNNLTEEKLAGMLDAKDISWNTKEFIRLMLTDEKEQSFESQCHRWIQSLLNKKIDLQTVRQDCSNILELSDFLNMCSYNERDVYQERLSLIIEQTGYYIKAAELIANDTKVDCENETTTQFIDNLFEKLRLSGFVYHPSKNFSILASIFLRKPELMNSRMKELLDIICGKDILIWEREPFGSALIKLLELYIRECDGKIDKTRNNKDLIDSSLPAIAIQLLLIRDTNNTNIADYRLNAARLCVLSSYLHHNPEKLIDAAYYNLFHSSAKLPSYTIGDVKMLPHYIFNSPCGNIDTTNTFSQGNGQLVISDKGIRLQTASSRETLRPVFPKELELWKGLQVFIPSKTKTNLSEAKLNDITPYQSVWTEIEAEFFNYNMKPVIVADKNKRQHRIGDTVKITFTGQDANDRNKYYCQIEDEIGGNGFIYVKDDIVCYSIATTSLRHFFAADGSRFIFEATIKDKEDDLFHFSMSEELKDMFSSEYYSTDEDIICSVGNAPNVYYGMSPAITQDGVSVSIENAGEFAGLKKHDIVRCRLIGPGTGAFHITCEIVDYAIDEDFDINTAFKKLMENSSVGIVPEAMSHEEQVFESDNLMDESYVREVIYMIDRMALLDTEYVKSYNYLGFARIMCLLIGWESQAAYYKGRMDIISMLHYFALNSKVDEEKLSQLENVNSELFSNNAILKERFMQLQTVSYMGNSSHNDDLFTLSNDNPSLKSLASLVLAYNITKNNGLESCATNIYNKVIQLLNLKGFETGLKLYGSGVESEEIEYKTSFIYYAEDNSSQPNPDRQRDEILKVINSFFNTRGGTLYIGVNNYGYGVGVEDDLKYHLFYGDKEKYIRTISDAVALEMSNLAATYVELSFDEANTDKDVLIAKIQPVPSGIPYRGSWYVRTAGSKRRLTKEEYTEYSAVRKLQAAPHAEVAEVQKAAVESRSDSSGTTQQLVKTKEAMIRTSRIRENVLDEWEEHYIEPIGFLKFLSDGKFKKVDKNYNDDDSLLTLAVKENEKKGFLILGYKNGCIVKTPVEELLEYKNRDYPRNTESPLIFASLANQDDAVLTISKSVKTLQKPLMRLDKLSGFKEGKLMEKGETPYNSGLLSEVLAFDIIPGEDTKWFEKIMNVPKTSLGVTNYPETKRIADRLHAWGINEI